MHSSIPTGQRRRRCCHQALDIEGDVVRPVIGGDQVGAHPVRYIVGEIGRLGAQVGAVIETHALHVQGSKTE
jgi:hypothetical protein